MQDGFYSNRTDFIRTAVRSHSKVTRTWSSGPRSERIRTSTSGTPAAKFLEAVRSAEEMQRIHVLGLASIAADVTPELARASHNRLRCHAECVARPLFKEGTDATPRR
jgi:Arc/MetJ-type ribon-helix-helix transcriptional regulator